MKTWTIAVTLSLLLHALAGALVSLVGLCSDESYALATPDVAAVQVILADSTPPSSSASHAAHPAQMPRQIVPSSPPPHDSLALSPAPQPTPAVPNLAPQTPHFTPPEQPPTSSAPNASHEPQNALHTPAKGLSVLQPEYPRSARQRGEEGEVRVRASIDAEGRVTDVALARSCGHAALDRAALAAVRKARFHPAQQDGRPVASQLVLPIVFRLKEGK